MKLIRELTENVEFVTEAREDGKKNYFITGPFLVAEKENKNGRIYRMNILEQEVARYMKDQVKEGRGYGELGHPSGPQINLDRVSHLIKELNREGNVFMGKALITDTPMGNIARGLMESGAKLGVSSRGLGSLQKNDQGIMEVQNDFRLATAADIVADPSGPNCFVNGLMEGVDWIFDPIKGTWMEEKASIIKEQIHKLSTRELEEKKLAIFENWISSLTRKNH
jgi:hypothetical protein